MARGKINDNSDLWMEFSKRIALVRTRDELLSLINSQLKKLFYFTHCSIVIRDEQERLLHLFVIDPTSKVLVQPKFEELTENKFDLDEYYTHKAYHSNEPMAFNIEQLATQKGKETLPIYMQLQLDAGVKQLLSVPLKNEMGRIGLLLFYSDRNEHFSKEILSFLLGISAMISIAVSNIIAQESVRKRNLEKEMLLSLSNEIATIKRKEELLSLISTKLKKLFYFSYGNIVAINEDKTTFSTYLIDPESMVKKYPEFDKYTQEKYAIKNPLFQKVLKSEDPLVFNLEEIAKSKKVPQFLHPQIALGLKELVAVALRGNNGIFGVLVFFSDKVSSFIPNHINIVKAVGSQVSIAIANIIATEELYKRSKEKELLLSISYEIAKVKDKNHLLTIINHQLRQLFYFTHSSISLLTEDRTAFIVYLTDPESVSRKHKDYESLVSTTYKINDGIGLFQSFLHSEEPIITDLDVIVRLPTVPRYSQIHYEAGIREMVSIPLFGEKEIIGVLHFYSDKKGVFALNSLEIFKAVASQVSIAVANILAVEDIKSREQEREMLLSLSYEMAKIRDRNELLTMINTKLKDLFYFTHSNISIVDWDKNTFTVFLLDPKSRSRIHPEFEQIVSKEYPMTDGIFDELIGSEEPTVSDIKQIVEAGRAPKYTLMHYESGLLEAASVPLYGKGKPFGLITFYSDKKGDFNPKVLRVIKGMSSQVSIAVSNILANQKIIKQLEEINRYRQQLEQENIYLQQEIGTVHNYSEIIGSSPAMQMVYKMLAQVSFTNSTVLILGETGTGKELIARAIHNNSSFKDKLMIKVNCAALPANLIESELFGHERGSFTGALERRIGKFELANNSTLFLDEIGELSLELQSKLLRVIQEREFERVGGSKIIKVNVRIVAATNRNLLNEVQEGRFRSDLFYRLNVFPIFLPPLRERKEDLPALTTHFINHYSRNTGIKIANISSLAMRKIQAYNWPGNIRELEHLIERSILLSNGTVIKEVYLPENTIDAPNQKSTETEEIKTISEIEKEHILKILSISKGRIQGPGGAAELLRIPPTTLHSKMKKLHIVKTHISPEE